MNDLKKLREELGLSQEELANYLGVGRSLISLVEINQRELPAKASLRYALFNQMYLQVIQKDSKLQEDVDKIQQVLQDELKSLAIEVYQLERQKKKMQAYHQKTAYQIQIFENMLSLLKVEDVDYKERKLRLEYFLSKAKQRRRHNPLEKLITLEAKWEALNHQIAFIKQKLQDLGME